MRTSQPTKKVSSLEGNLTNFSIPVKTDQLNKLIANNAKMFKQIKANLAMMKIDIQESITTSPDEPETRVKKTVHHTFTTKFREVLRTSQAIQTEFKNAV